MNLNADFGRYENPKTVGRLGKLATCAALNCSVSVMLFNPPDLSRCLRKYTVANY